MPKNPKTKPNLKVLAITHLGISDITAKEALEISAAKDIIVNKASIVFEVSSVSDAAKFAYKAQSVQRVVLLCAEYNLTADDKFTANLKEQLIKDDGIKTLKFLSKKTFASRFLRQESESEASSSLITLEIEALIGEHIYKTYKLKVDLKQPDLIFLSYFEDNKFYLGIDIAGFDLSKRDYRLFTHPTALKGTIAYSLLRIGDYNLKDVLIDPFCGSGTIIIEAALFKSGLSPHYYKKDKFLLSKIKELKIDFNKFDDASNLVKKQLADKKVDKKSSDKDTNFSSLKKESQNNPDSDIKSGTGDIIGIDINFSAISSSRKNAKIANVLEYVKFSRMDISWIDTKFKEKTLDKIITNPPKITRSVDPKDIEKIYKELFYQAEFVLKSKCTITVVTSSPEMMKQKAEEYKFKLLHERELWHGKEMLNVLVFEKQEK
ncbi:TPA: methyltransferase domain-containing protein [Candidatus Woesearchaeota archaeon]|nr:methyltransferase domain-containing protein [Candidatus Woesearchaeota archaeon]